MLVNRIKRDWSAYTIKKCKSGRRTGKCEICSTRGVPSVILDCDRLMRASLLKIKDPRSGKVNDCLLIEHDGILHIAVIELKSSRYNSTQVVEQLLAGRNIALSLLSRYSYRKKYEIHLIVVAKAHHIASRWVFYNSLKNPDGTKSRIIMAKCGDTLKSIRTRKRDR